jgi:xanthine dehydrogenase iron-sulfur cluster and FAD-binding subunit A
MILAAFHLLHKKPDPTMEDIREGLYGNLCRCTGYIQIFEAVAEAARRRATTGDPIRPNISLWRRPACRRPCRCWQRNRAPGCPSPGERT